jgi:hypothetical protein
MMTVTARTRHAVSDANFGMLDADEEFTTDLLRADSEPRS